MVLRWQNHPPAGVRDERHARVQLECSVGSGPDALGSNSDSTIYLIIVGRWISQFPDHKWRYS